MIRFVNEARRRWCQKGIFDKDDDERMVNILNFLFFYDCVEFSCLREEGDPWSPSRFALFI